MRAYLRDASHESSSLFAPVTTILPEAKIRSVVLGSRIRIMTVAKRYRTKRISVQRHVSQVVVPTLGVILCIPSVQYNGLEVETAIEVDCGNYFVM